MPSARLAASAREGKNGAIHAQHKPALSCRLPTTSGSPLLNPQPRNAVWLCQPRTSVKPLKALDPSKRSPLPSSLGAGRDRPRPGLHVSPTPCSQRRGVMAGQHPF